jgi:hypothetical protein
MIVGERSRWRWIALGGLALLVVGGAIAFRLAVGILRDRVIDALGPESTVAEIRVGWSSLEVEGLEIAGPAGWPASAALRAERVTLVPSLRSLFSGQLRVGSITAVQPYLSMLRTKDGRLQVLPGLLVDEKGAEPPAAPPPLAAAAASVTIDRITLLGGVLDLFDASVAQPPFAIHLEQVEATMLDVAVPSLLGKTRFDLSAVLEGPRQAGTVTIVGWAEIASRDSSLKTALRSVDLRALEPYLIRAGERGVKKGSLDLDLQSAVSRNRIRAPGQLTISDLELDPATGAFGTFMGLPRDAVLGALKNRRGQIAVSFVLEGNIDDPQFSLNEAFTTRLASSLAETLGVSLSGLATGVGSLGQQGVEAVGDAAKGAVQQIFQGDEKR